MILSVEMEKHKQIVELMKMLAWMELCGNIGHCTSFRVIFDGDGTAKLATNLVGKHNQAVYDSIKNDLLDKWNAGYTEDPVFEFGL